MKTVLQTHLRGYIDDYEKLSKAGAEVVVCVAVNDPFVVAAWSEASGAKGKVSISEPGPQHMQAGDSFG